MAADPAQAIKIFYCYAHEDRALRDELEKHLTPLKRMGQITEWHDRDIQAGTNWAQEIKTHLNTANIILLLVSSDFINSDYCWSVEMKRALERHRTGEARVIPIILRRCDWEETPIGELQALPPEGKPISQWADRDEAFWSVARGVRETVRLLLTQMQQAEEERMRKAAEEEQSLREAAELLEAAHKAKVAAAAKEQEAQIARIAAEQERIRKATEETIPLPSLPDLTPPVSVQSLAMPVTLTHLLGKDFLLVTDESQVAYLLLEVKATELMTQVRLPWNIAMVVDHSGSTKGAKLRLLKEAVNMVIDRLEPTDYISLVIYDDTAQVIIPSMPANDKPGMKAAVDHIRDAGGTTMSLGMIQGLNELRRWNIPNALNRMILFTDGVTYGDTERCHQLARDAAAAGIAIYPMGIGADWDKNLMDEIGQLSGGIPAEFIRKPSDVISTIERQLQSAAKVEVAVRGAVLTLRAPVGVSITKAVKVLPAFHDFDHAGLPDRGLVIPLGDLEKANPHTVLVELMVDPRPAGLYRIAQAELSYDMPTSVDEKLRHDIKVTFTTDSKEAEQVNMPVMNYAQKVFASRR